MRRVAVAAVAAAATLVLAGCATGTVSATSGPTAAAAPAGGTSLSPIDFAATAKLPDTTLLDVRTAAEFAAGHLPGAVNLDVQSPDFAQRAATLDPGRNYAVYCHSGNRSKVAMTALARSGFTHLFDLAGGIGAWQSAGGEVVTR